MRYAVGLLLLAVVAVGAVWLLSEDDELVEAGPWGPTAAITPFGADPPSDWAEVQKFAISMESGKCVGGDYGDPRPHHIEVDESGNDITITAYADISDTGPSGCDGVGHVIDVGVVSLEEPIGDRKLVDGSIDHRYVVGPDDSESWRKLLPRQ